MTPRSRRLPAVLFLAAAALAVPAVAPADETLTDIVNVLRDEGLIDEAEHAELAAKAARKQDLQDWIERISVWADFRVRYEAFLYEQDSVTQAAGETLDDRHRGRYRARINLSGEVNDRVTVYFRLASGGDDPRTTNQSLGDDEDFDTDDIRFDLAYVTLSPYAGGALPGVENGYLAVDLGKVKNPYLWKDLGSDKLLWDSDFTFEGGNLRMKGGAGPVDLFANAGIYLIDENSSGKDPKMATGQLGGTTVLAEHVTLGARSTLYHLFSLDDDFFDRSIDTDISGGNIEGGLSRRNGSIQILEASAFLEIDCFELFPVLFHGTYARNLSARSSDVVVGVGREDDAWAVGVLVGDKKRLVQVGFGYYYVEANAFPSMYLDSDVLDGVPNRQGYELVLKRQLFEGVELVLQGFKSKRIESGVAFADSVSGSDRMRGRADLKFEF